jgi:hypothetical protein
MDNAEILIPDSDNLVGQAELFLSSYIEYDDRGFHLTKKGYTTVWNHLKNLPPAERMLLCLFFEENSDYG